MRAEIRGGRSGTEAGFSMSPSAPRWPSTHYRPRTHLSPPHEVCDSPDQAAHCHTLRNKLGASRLTDTWLVSQ
jgi:hypothetical protein